jgi:hypothetical protein
MFLTGIWVALPMVFVVPAALGISIVDVVRGPRRLRARVLTLWGVAIAVFALAAVGRFLVAAALLAVGLVSLVALPCAWLVQPRAAR